MFIPGLDVGGAPLYLVDGVGYVQIPLREIGSLGSLIVNMRPCLFDALSLPILSLFGAAFDIILRSGEGFDLRWGNMRCSDIGKWGR